MAYLPAARGVDTLLTADEAGRLFGITGRQIQSLAKQGVFPKAGRGKYRLGDVVAGYISTLRTQEERRRIDVARQEYWHLRAERLKVSIDERRDTLAVDAEERARAVLDEGLRVIRNALLGIAGRSTRVAETRAAIEREVEFALAVASRHFEPPEADARFR